MSDYIPVSKCGRVLLDSSLFADNDLLRAETLSLREDQPDREIWLLVPGDRQCPENGDDQWDRILGCGDEDNVQQVLEDLHRQDDLIDTMLVTGQERMIAWARQRSVAVLSPLENQSLASQLSSSSLVVRDTAALVLRAKRLKEDRPFLIGINGIDKSGKTVFTKRLAEQLQVVGFQTELLSLDIFTAPKKIRKARGYSDADRLYHRYFAVDRLQEQLLKPLQQQREGAITIDVYNVDKERVVEKINLDLDNRSMVLLEGPFLFQEDLFPAFDFRIYLVTDFEKAMELELSNLSGKKRERRKREFTMCELAAQSNYLRRETPWKRAHIVLRGVNGQAPSIEQWATELTTDLDYKVGDLS
jgi:uridine kinase